MSDEKIFVDGLYFNRKHPNAPDFVLGSLSIQPKQLIEWMRKHHESVNDKGYFRLDVNESRQGKTYVALSTWKPGEQKKPDDGFDDGFDDDVPF